MADQPPGNGSGNPPNIHHLFEDSNNFLSGGGFKFVAIAFVVLAVGSWLSAGIYQVEAGEEAVVVTFGKYSRTETSGLKFRWPWPIEAHQIVDIKNIRQITIGFRQEPSGKERVIPSEALMLTEDENIVQVYLSIQYQISDTYHFLFRTREPDQVLKTAAEVALRSVVGSFTIDATMTDKRGQVQDEIRAELERMLKLYETGLKVIEVRIIKVDPPEQVKDAFHDVVRAREDGQKVVREAEGEAAQLIPGAEAEQLEIVAIAEAEKEQRILRSTGDAQRFTLVFDAYSNAPRITRERLYLEAVEKALATAEKVVLPPGISNQVLPWFALRRSQGDTGPGDAALPETAENSSIGKESK